ncbi:hypothetical protein CEXT_300201 [Caerostris extrusa]|uniref:Uncharacterized protein n=1 Tax=Caerostris extrusa TaxID=172846 RepID=A0AAV4TWZ6_CAEEX|nr:hypothetical protein CEXT_300201 [Caerostris extrusa]
MTTSASLLAEESKKLCSAMPEATGNRTFKQQRFLMMNDGPQAPRAPGRKRTKLPHIFSPCRQKPHNPSLIHDSERIQITQPTWYLGIEVEIKLRRADHIESEVNKAPKRLKMIKRLTRTIWVLSKMSSSLPTKSMLAQC